MGSRPRRFWILIIILVLTTYAAVVLRGLTESTRRTLLLRDESDSADRVFISIVVTNANPSTQELTARLGFRLAGNLAKDDVTPAVDLKLLVNNVREQQEFDFPYETTVRLLMTTPARDLRPEASTVPAKIPELTHPDDELVVSSNTLLSNTPVGLSVSISASIPGVQKCPNTLKKVLRTWRGRLVGELCNPCRDPTESHRQRAREL
jgi:hypothetical protein